jgi:peptide/nickel transport system substrate-binding protein
MRNHMPRLSQPGRLSLSLLAIVLLAAACGGDDDSSTSDGGSADESGEPRPGGTLQMGFHHYPATLDPHAGDNGFDVVVLNPIFDRLVNLDPETQEPIPGLATAWEFSPEGIDLTLQEGVTFHDGTPFDAEAVKFNIERAKGLGETESELQDVESVNVVSEHEVRLNLARPNAALVPILARRAGMMISPTAAQAPDADVDAEPVGTGPYQLASRVTDESIVLERYEGYWQDGVAHVDQLEFTIIDDSRTRLNALLSDQVDMALYLEPADLERAQQAEGQGMVVATAPSEALQRCQFNLGGDGPVSDPLVREALNYGINREAMEQVLTMGEGVVSGGEIFALPSNHWAYPSDVLPQYSYDPEKATDLLEEAGYDDGLTIRLAGYQTTLSDQITAMLEEQLSQIGVTLEPTIFDLTEVTSAYLEGGHDMYCGLQGPRPDPWGTLQHWLTWIPAPWEPSAELQGLIEDTIATDDISERQAAFDALTEYMVDEEAMGIGLVYGVTIQTYTEQVKGFEVTHPDPFRDVWLDE